MRNWVFDIQRFATAKTAAIETLTVSGPSSASSVVYYDLGATTTLTNTGLDITSLSNTASPADGHSYIRVKVDAAGQYTLDVIDYETGETAATMDASTDNHATVDTLNFTSGVATGNVKTTAAGNGTVTITSIIAKTATGGSITATAATNPGSALTYKAASGSQAEITFGSDAVASELTSGSIVLSTTAGTSIKVNGEVVTADATGFTVSSTGTISGLSAGNTVIVGADATPSSGYTYEVSADGLKIELTSANGTTDDGVYLLTSKLSNTTISVNGTATLYNEISNGARTADDIHFTIDNAAGDDQNVLGVADSSVKTYVYKKNGEILQAGYSDSSIGTYLGTLSYDGSQFYMYDASTSSAGQHIDNPAGGTSVTTVKGGSGNDTIAATNTDTVWTNTVAVTIDGGAGNDFIHINPISGSSIVGGAGNDTLRVSGLADTSANVALLGGEGNDLVDDASTNLGQTTSAWTISTGAGNDTIDFSSTTSTGTEWSINSGDGNNTISLGTGITYSTITAGSGNDTITSNSATNTITGGSGADVFDISRATTNAANIADYTYGTDFIRVANSGATKDTFLTDINTVAQTTTNITSEGKLSWTQGTAAAATITSSAGFYAVNLVDNQTAKNKASLAWAKDDATTINAASLTESAVLVGTTNTEGDLIVGGSKADTIYAGANDSVYGGAGADAISLGASAYGVYVGVATDSGADTVANFNVGFDIDSADAVYMVNGSLEDATISNDGTNVTVKSGKGSLELTNKGNNSTDGVKLLVGDKKVYSIAEGVQLAISDAEDLADYYYGTKSTANGSGISLANYADDVSVDLSNAMFKNIASVTGGSANTTIMGSTAAETLFGGTGATSLYGGAGKDSLVSGTGVTTFFLTNGVGKDSVSGFVTGTDESTSDVVNIFNASLTGITRSAADSFTVKVSDTDSLQIAQATSGVDQKIQWVSGSAKGVAKIGMNSTANSFTYEEDVTNYLGGSKNDTISFGSGSDDINLWLDQTSAVSSIETFDASSRSGSVLIAGSSSASETIRGGSGDSSLWGGAGSSADVLIGNSSGTTSFFYGMGQGSDSISGGSNDTVNLYDMQLSDLASANVDTSNRRVIFTTTAGDTVTVSGGVQNFTVGGTTYQTSYASSTDWTAKE